MRKIILTSILSLLLIFTASINTYAYTESDIVYTWEETNIVASGLTLNIDEASQIWTITGTMTGSQAFINMTQSLYEVNAASSSLSALNDYIIEYENITNTTFEVSLITLKFSSNLNAINTYNEMKISPDELENKLYNILSTDTDPRDPDVLVDGTAGNNINISFKVNIYAYDTKTVNDVNLFDTNMSETFGSLDVSITDFNTITLNGSSSSSEASINLTSYLTSLDPQKSYLIKYVYVSGTLTDSTGVKLRPIKVNDINSHTISDTNKAMFTGYSTPTITAFTIEPYISASVNYTNFTYKLLLEEVVLSSTPTIPDDGYNALDWIETDGYLVYDIANNLPTEVDDIASIYFNPLHDITDYEFAASSDLTHQAIPSDTTGIKLVQTIDQAMTVHYQIVLHPSDEIIMISETNPDALWNDISIRLAVTPSVVNFYIDEVIDSSENTIVGEKVTKPVDPTKTGFTFIGWYLEETYTTLFDFNTDTVDAEVFNLYARFVDETTDVFTVSFDENGGSLIDDRMVVSGEATSTPTAPTKTGFTFNGWFTDEDLTQAYDFTSLVTADITLYAKWTESTTAPVSPGESGLSTTEWILIGVAAVIVVYAFMVGKKK